MGWSSRPFLVAADGELLRLAGAAFSRMLRPGSPCRVPQFAAQRLRMAEVVVETADRVVLGVRHVSFSVLSFDADGCLDVAQLNTHQVARPDVMLSTVLAGSGSDAKVVDAACRFAARGGSWEPDPPLRRRIESAALGTLSCARVKVVEGTARWIRIPTIERIRAQAKNSGIRITNEYVVRRLPRPKPPPAISAPTAVIKPKIAPIINRTMTMGMAIGMRILVKICSVVAP